MIHQIGFLAIFFFIGALYGYSKHLDNPTDILGMIFIIVFEGAIFSFIAYAAVMILGSVCELFIDKEYYFEQM